MRWMVGGGAATASGVHRKTRAKTVMRASAFIGSSRSPCCLSVVVCMAVYRRSVGNSPAMVLPSLGIVPAVQPFQPGTVLMVVRQPALHPTAALERREDGHVLTPLPALPQAHAFARQPEQVALAGESCDQRPKAFPRLGREVGQRGGVEYAQGCSRRRRCNSLGEDGEGISGHQGRGLVLR